MDADLQDPPDLLLEMYGRFSRDDALDCVAARRLTRDGEPFLRTLGAKSFYWLMSKISDVPLISGARDFRLMTRRMVDSILELDERNRFSKGIFGWVGYRTEWVEYENIERAAGRSSWSLFGLMKYSVEGIVDFSTVPLSIASYCGFLICAIAAIWIVIIVAKTLLWGNDATGYPSLACIVLLLGGLQLLSVGVLGQYLARTYIETKARPLYFVKESK